tara:strand:- start:9046 stop:9183 length:138 start_codon:yes stop_codon:yes gene_type:complete
MKQITHILANAPKGLLFLVAVGLVLVPTVAMPLLEMLEDARNTMP